MRISIGKVMLIIVVYLLAFFIGRGHCNESTMAIKLNNEIRANMSDFRDISENLKIGQKEWSQKQEDVLNEIDRTTSAEKKENLVKKYLYLRAKELKEQAELTDKLHDLTVSTIGKMENLQEIMNDEGMNFTEADKQIVSQTVKGVAHIIDNMKQLDPNNGKLNTATNILRTIDFKYKNVFSKRGKVNIKDQIELMYLVASFIQSARELMETERNYLLSNVYGVIQAGIIRVLNENNNMIDFDSLQSTYENKWKNDERAMHALDIKGGLKYSNPVSLDDVGNY